MQRFTAIIILKTHFMRTQYISNDVAPKYPNWQTRILNVIAVYVVYMQIREFKSVG